jgi:hypothetical protein
MRFIHLSDLHFFEDDNQRRVLVALYKDISKVAKSDNVDAVFFTGDFASKGNTEDTAINGICDVLNNIKSAVGSNVPLLICPGNHDINLTARKSIFQPIFEAINTPESASELVAQAKPDDISGIWGHMDGFLNIARNLDSSFYSENMLMHAIVLSIGSKSVGIAMLNSAWNTKGGGTQDYGKLFIGQYQIDTALKKIGHCDIKIALMCIGSA